MHFLAAANLPNSSAQLFVQAVTDTQVAFETKVKQGEALRAMLPRKHHPGPLPPPAPSTQSGESSKGSSANKLQLLQGRGLKTHGSGSLLPMGRRL